MELEFQRIEFLWNCFRKVHFRHSIFFSLIQEIYFLAKLNVKINRPKYTASLNIQKEASASWINASSCTFIFYTYPIYQTIHIIDMEFAGDSLKLWLGNLNLGFQNDKRRHRPSHLYQDWNQPDDNVVAWISIIDEGKLSTSSQLVMVSPNSFTVENKKLSIQFIFVESVPS